VNVEETPLKAITERLEALAGRLRDEDDPTRAAELVQEASKLAAEAGEEVDRALRDAQGGAGGAPGA
jgi:hypothetical protein